MFSSNKRRLAGALSGVLLALSLPGVAIAGPMTFPTGTVLLEPAPVTQVHYRRPVRRSGVAPAAVLGLFGAVLGGMIANQRYDNYSNYAYGQPYDYGYAPGYVARPIYRGGGGRAFGGRVRAGGSAAHAHGGAGRAGRGGAHAGHR